MPGKSRLVTTTRHKGKNYEWSFLFNVCDVMVVCEIINVWYCMKDVYVGFRSTSG